MDFKSYLQQSAIEIENTISSYLKSWNNSITSEFPKLLPLTELLVKGSEGGKRLRGTLVKLGYEMVSGQKSPEILKASTAVEIFQTAILAHDDIIDQSPTRRGNPTLYRQLGGNHYAISQTICLGDIGFFLALQCLVDSNFDQVLKNKAVSEFSKMFINTGLGQMLDIELPHLSAKRQESDVLVIHKYKTSYYTIIYPLIIGAILGGGDQVLIRKIESLGESLGIAYQIQDDLLGVFGDEEIIGKSASSDIEEGKNTLLIVKAYKNADHEQRQILDNYYGQGAVDKEKLDLIRGVFKETGALDYSRKQAQFLVNNAKQEINSLMINESYKKLLIEMADFLVERAK